jgi:hypothetical protein
MKTTMKTIVTVAFMLSVSSTYAQSETQVVKSRSNIKTQRTADGDPIKLGDVKLGKGIMTETDEGWVFENATLTDEQKEYLIKTFKLDSMPNRLSVSPTVRKQTQGVSFGEKVTAGDIDKVLKSGNFVINKGEMSAKEIKATRSQLGDLFSKI